MICDCGSWDGAHPGDCSIFATPASDSFETEIIPTTDLRKGKRVLIRREGFEDLVVEIESVEPNADGLLTVTARRSCGGDELPNYYYVRP